MRTLRQVLQGLVPVEVTADDLRQTLFGSGTAVTVEQLRQRLEGLPSERCRGQDLGKVRIVFKA